MMSSVPTERRVLQSRTPLIRVNPRALATVVVACVGMFALSFAIGRALSPGRGRTEALPEFAATQASAEIPVSLSAAPSLERGTPVAAVVHAIRRAPKARAATNTPLTSSAPSVAPTLTQQASPPPPATPVSTPAPVVVTPAPAKAPARTPASTQPAGGTSAPKHGGGGSVSFDSSG